METLNHMMIGDLIWLSRFNGLGSGFAALDGVKQLPKPSKLNDTLIATLPEFQCNRQNLDQIIVVWIQETTESDYAQTLSYTNTKQHTFCKPFALYLR